MNAAVVVAALVCGHSGVTLVSQSGTGGCQIPPPAGNWICVNGGWVPSPGLPPPGSPQPQSTPAAQVINVGEPVTGMLTTTHPEMVFDLTAPSDGTLVVHLSPGDVYLQLEGVYWSPMWRPPGILTTIGTLQVAAGQTYRIRVWTLFGYYYYYFEQRPFVLTTSIESGPVTIPAACENPPPAAGWICISGGGWVPPGHPLAMTDPPNPPPTEPPSTPPPPPPPPPGPVDCPSLQPAPTWLCVNGGWLPPDHPLAQSAPTNPPPPAPPTAPPPGCTTPDPFVGIPGLVGVCVAGGWVPSGHPLAEATNQATATNPITDYTGTYTLTVAAGGSCIAALPDELKHRTYTARIEQTAAALRVSLSGPDFVIARDGSGNSFGGEVSATGEIRFRAMPTGFSDSDAPDVLERLADGRTLCIAGTILARSSPQGISGAADPLAGAWIYRCDEAYGFCSIDRFEMVRR